MKMGLKWIVREVSIDWSFFGRHHKFLLIKIFKNSFLFYNNLMIGVLFNQRSLNKSTNKWKSKTINNNPNFS